MSSLTVSLAAVSLGLSGGVTLPSAPALAQDAVKSAPPIVIVLLPADKRVNDQLGESMVELKNALRDNARLQILGYSPDAPSFIVAAKSAGVDLKRLTSDDQREALSQALGAKLWVKVGNDKRSSGEIVVGVYETATDRQLTAGQSAMRSAGSPGLSIDQAAQMILGDAIPQPGAVSPPSTASSIAPANAPLFSIAPPPAALLPPAPVRPMPTPTPAIVVPPVGMPPPSTVPVTTLSAPASAPAKPLAASAPSPPPAAASPPALPLTSPTAISVPSQPAPAVTAISPAAQANSLPIAVIPAPRTAPITPGSAPSNLSAHLPATPNLPAETPQPSAPTITSSPTSSIAEAPAIDQQAPAQATGSAIPNQKPETAPAPTDAPVALSAKPATPLDATTQSLLDQGDAAMSRSDDAGAIEYYRSAVNESPLNAAPRIRLAQAYVASGNSQAAFSELQRAVAIDPQDNELSAFLQQAAQQHSIPGVDVLELIANAASKPSDQQSQLALGDAYWNSKALVLAERAYAQAAHAANDSARAAVPYARLARLYAATQRYSECLKALSLSGSFGYPAALRIIQQQSDILLGNIDSQLQQFGSGAINRTQLYDQLRSLDNQASSYASFLGKVSPPNLYRLSYLHRKLAANLIAQMTPNLLNYALTAQTSYLSQSQSLEHDALAEIDQANAIDRVKTAETSSVP